MKIKSLSDSYDTREIESFRPQLTSLIDVMTILLVFLIQNFSVEGNLITPSQDLSIPVSSVKEKPEMMISVQISGEKVMVDNHVVANINDFSSAEEFLIPSLFDRMKEAKGRNSETKVMLEADRELPFNVIKRVAYTCSQAGFTDFSVLVFQEDK